MAIDQVLRAAGEVGQRGVRLYSQVCVECCVNFPKVDWSIFNSAADSICRSDDLPSPHSTAGDESSTDLRPVVSAGVAVNARRAAEFSPSDDRNVVGHSSFMQIIDQGGQALIEQRQVGVFEPAEVVAVKIPAAKVQRHHSCACLDQPAGHEELLQIPRRAVAKILGVALAVLLTRLRRFSLQVQGVGQSTGCQHVERLCIEVIDSRNRSARIDIPSQSIEPGKQAFPVVEPIEANAAELHILTSWAAGPEGGMADPQETWVTRRAVGRMPGVGRQSDEWRNGSVGWAPQA